MSDATITTEKKGRVFLIGLNRPKQRNSFTYSMVEELSNAYAEMEKDPDVRCGLLFAHGKHFTLGLDLPAFSEELEKSGRLPLPAGNVDPFALAGPFRSKPMICAVQGFCYTIGIELMLASDINLLAQNAKLAQMEVGRGLLPYCGGSFRFIERAGWHNAMRYVLTGDIFDAEEALRIGLAQSIHPAGELMDKALEMAETVARQSPVGVMASLAQARKYIERAEADGIDGLMARTLEVMKSDDFKEGVLSFQEKRAADFG